MKIFQFLMQVHKVPRTFEQWTMRSASSSEARVIYRLQRFCVPLLIAAGRSFKFCATTQRSQKFTGVCPGFLEPPVISSPEPSEREFAPGVVQEFDLGVTGVALAPDSGKVSLVCSARKWSVSSPFKEGRGHKFCLFSGCSGGVFLAHSGVLSMKEATSSEINAV